MQTWVRRAWGVGGERPSRGLWEEPPGPQCGQGCCWLQGGHARGQCEGQEGENGSKEGELPQEVQSCGHGEPFRLLLWVQRLQVTPGSGLEHPEDGCHPLLEPELRGTGAGGGVVLLHVSGWIVSVTLAGAGTMARPTRAVCGGASFTWS